MSGTPDKFDTSDDERRALAAEALTEVRAARDEAKQAVTGEKLNLAEALIALNAARADLSATVNNYESAIVNWKARATAAEAQLAAVQTERNSALDQCTALHEQLRTDAAVATKHYGQLLAHNQENAALVGSLRSQLAAVREATIEECAAICARKEVEWHDSDEENSGHWMDAASTLTHAILALSAVAKDEG